MTLDDRARLAAALRAVGQSIAILADVAATAIANEYSSAPLPGPQSTRMLSISEASEVFGISRNTLHNLVREQKIRSVKIGRRRLIPADALDHMSAVATAPRRSR